MSAPLAVHEGPAAPYFAKPQQRRHSREGGNPVWKIVRLGEISEAIQYGHTASAVQSNEGPRFLRITDIQNGQVDWPTVPTCDIPASDVPKYRLGPGDIVFARTGATTGKSFLIAHCPEAVFASYLIRVRLKTEVLPSFVYLFFQSPAYWRQIEAGKRGIGQPNVNGSVLSQVEIPVPPLDEQRRIVAELETQLTRLDASVTALKRVQANLKRHRASVLKAACEGRLVPTEVAFAPRTDPATKLLANILAMRRKEWSGRGSFREPVRPDSSVLPELPAYWCWATVDQLADIGTGATPKRGKADYYEGGAIPWVTSGVVGKSFVREASEFVTEKAIAETNLTLYPPGTLIVAMYGEGKTRGKCSELLIAATTNQALAAIEAHPSIKAYLKVFLLMNYEDTRKVASGGVQPNLNLSLIRSICVPLPPLLEQRRIVAEVERRFSVIEKLEATVTANLKRAERLRQTVLSRAFTESKAVSATAPARINQHFARAVLSAEIVFHLHAEPTFGRVKHQKIFHLCEHIARLPGINGQYHREAAGPLDNKLIYANEAELKRQKWFEEFPRADGYGHAYRRLPKAGLHDQYVERYWPSQIGIIRKLIELMRLWDTQRCEIFSTAYAAWNDLLLWGREPSEAAILNEVLNRWHEKKRKVSEDRWCKAIAWIKAHGYEPTGFGSPTTSPAK